MNINVNINEQDILKLFAGNGTLDLSLMQETYKMNKRQELLEMHPFKIWEGKDGKWYTYLPDEEEGRILKKRGTKKSIEDIVVTYWKARAENPTIREVFDEWNDRRLELKKISDATHLRIRQIYDRHYITFGQQRIKSVNPEDKENLQYNSSG